LPNPDSEETKQKAQQFWDEAEAMLRGAWALKPANEDVIAAFQDLAKHAGPIALVRAAVVRAKPNGLVVLDAEPSIIVKDKPFYCVWEQVDGEDLCLRPENMAQKKVGIRIKKVGTYKFEIAVSDGVRGGNPLSVVVEVSE
jgi:hypothetical protein